MNVAVIFGGESCEHDISIITGLQLISKINEYLYNIVPIYITKNGEWVTGENLKDLDNFNGEIKGLKNCSLCVNEKTLYIKKGKKFVKFLDIDMAFVCLHGLRGEDGSVASILELCKIPYSSSSICSSAICMDKCIFKYCAKGLGLDVVDGFEIVKDVWLESKNIVVEKICQLGFPIIIKPSRQGSSIGIEVCEKIEDIDTFIEKSFKFDDKLLIEKFIDVEKEVNIAILDNKGEYIISSTEEPISTDKILSFDNKYKNNPKAFEGIKRIVPAKISQKQNEKIIYSATKLYKCLEMFGVVRFDFIIATGGEVYLNEVNTIPGSMANYLFKGEDYLYSKLIDIIISNALFRKEREGNVFKTINTGVEFNDFNSIKK